MDGVFEEIGSNTNFRKKYVYVFFKKEWRMSKKVFKMSLQNALTLAYNFSEI